MKPIRTFNVSPSLPPRLEPLRQLAYNLHWDWNYETTDLFRRLDRDLWEASRYNPVLMLGTISQDRLREAAEDEGFLAHMDRAARQLEEYLNERTWYRKQRQPMVDHRTADALGSASGNASPQAISDCYAYFSAEFGLTTCLPIYSGGLGVLAGDHLKSASDLGLPLVGVGLLYQEGYFAQYLNPDGWQQERYPINDFYNMPLHLERQADGSELRISVDYPGRQVQARVWRVQVGTVPLYLLDTNIEPNSQYDQDITDELYGGDIDLRIHQEMMLGIGGVRMLRALGLQPTVYHMNEGHSAFLSLERMRILIEEEGLTFAEAKQVVKASQIFTTHTPVPAGIDLFPSDKVLYYLGHYADKFGLVKEEFLSLGRENTGDLASPFSMAILAIKMATFVNGVSQLHGAVSREMFKGLWAQLPLDEVPVSAITNGVHARSCVAKSTQDLYDRYLGPSWSHALADNPLWDRVSTIPDEELWRNHERCRSELIMFVRERLQRSLRDLGSSAAELDAVQDMLDPAVLTIGFARRFATYKRATLFLRDVDRIKRILLGQSPGKDSALRPRTVQFIIAGKAHPKDTPGKELIRQIIHFIREEEMHHHVVFIPNYDIHVSRLMVAGCDIWLNTPRRPREASGTSGMKAAMNGLPNLSVLDGWWDEADYVNTGWAIGHGEVYDDPDYQDDVEANALYELLEQEIVPLFYERDKDDLPRNWIAKMKNAIRLNCPHFNTARMVTEYALRGYFPASDRYRAMIAQDYAPAKELAHWQSHLFEHWYEMRIEDIDVSTPSEVKVNQVIGVKARLKLGELTPNDVQVELYQGEINADGDIVNGVPVVMNYQGPDPHNPQISLYQVDITYRHSGFQGLSLRVLPKHENLSNPYEPGLILWA
ncbi:MAG: alpha-glucan family phosphorylase [Synechococcales cyanobacterium M58_A2018_015]|nr:alpha-glucan family phosphorylase [Synechococcales cyanobacterium M58_A2018_015]